VRILEISVLIVLAAALIGFFFRSPRRPAWLRILSWTALVLMLAHFGIEGYRWQIAPAYLLVALGCLLTLKRAPHQATRDSRWRTAARVAGAVLRLAVCGGTGFLAVTIPVFDDPAPSGPFRVGTTRLHLVDRSREGYVLRVLQNAPSGEAEAQTPPSHSR
jgi:hypothetical protein